MRFSSYEKEFRRIAEKRNYPSSVIENCLKYAKVLLDNGVPVIYNTTHLSNLIGYTKSYIKRATHHTPYFYRKYSILKKNGSKRFLSEPLPSLKEIQIFILTNILSSIKVSRYAKAYVSGRTLIDHLKFHKGQKCVLTLDIENFFSSISTESIEKIFLEIGYTDIVSNLLARLCTLENSLPQGAPTSPYLSNLYLKGFDQELAKIVRPMGINYTRYADDMAFSGDTIDKEAIIEHVSRMLSGLGLVLNPDKTLLMVKPSRQVISGIVVNEKIQVPRKIRRSIRQSVYYIRKFGFESHKQKTKIYKRNYDKHLLGLINYILFINPKDQEFQSYKEELEKIIKDADNNGYTQAG
ncbi:MAG: RNA-directed DNA polymerase [Trichodesmium erythraeum GBRTRLIN201]|nr:RNA-directed DNA polymerase [Trichodesmium erythraeum GBRTRLIN201]